MAERTLNEINADIQATQAQLDELAAERRAVQLRGVERPGDRRARHQKRIGEALEAASQKAKRRDLIKRVHSQMQAMGLDD